jgi:acyl-CoA dehydrogenase
MWDFSTEPEFQKKLDWMDEFVRQEVEPLELVFNEPGAPYNVKNGRSRAAIAPLQEEVRRQGLWACHLGQDLGGPGYGQVKLALMNEILGRTVWGPRVFGTQAPDSGNAEILAMYGTAEQKARFLQPLLDGDIVSCFSMTEPQGGADPRVFTTRARREGNHWRIDGEKWFSSNAAFASFLIVMCVTDPDVPIHKGASMFLVPTDTPGVEIVRKTGTMEEPIGEGTHPYLRFTDVRIPLDDMLGQEGEAFTVAQARLAAGRLHHAMRTVGMCKRAIEMMCERAMSRHTQGSLLGEKQFIQGDIADSWIEWQQFRLQVLQTAWIIDQGDHHGARLHIAGVKAAMPKVMQDIFYRAMHMHGSLGVSNEMPLGKMWMSVPRMAAADGPTEVHKITIAKSLLRGRTPTPGHFPTSHLIDRIAAAEAKYADLSDDVRADDLTTLDT